MTFVPARYSPAVTCAASLASLVIIGLLGGCASWPVPHKPTGQTTFALDDTATTSLASAQPLASAPTLLVGSVRAAAGYDSPRFVYVRKAHELQYYATARWIDTPARMFVPLAAQALERTGAFRAVVRAPTAAASELQLDLELIRLQHEFTVTPSRVRVTLQAVLVDSASRRVVDSRRFDVSVTAPSDDPAGGVAAANQAVHQALSELAAFCAAATTR